MSEPRGLPWHCIHSLLEGKEGPEQRREWAGSPQALLPPAPENISFLEAQPSGGEWGEVAVLEETAQGQPNLSPLGQWPWADHAGWLTGVFTETLALWLPSC